MASKEQQNWSCPHCPGREELVRQPRADDLLVCLACGFKAAPPSWSDHTCKEHGLTRAAADGDYFVRFDDPGSEPVARFKLGERVMIVGGPYKGTVCDINAIRTEPGCEPVYEMRDAYGTHASAVESALQPTPQKFSRKKPKGIHKDAGKPRLDLVPHEGLLAAARALEHGLVKYPAHNYMNGLGWMSLTGSILRHLFRWIWDGRPDEESGLSDLDHLCADVLMLAAIVRRHPQLDDRPCREFPPNDQK